MENQDAHCYCLIERSSIQLNRTSPMDYGLKVIPTEELKTFPLDDSDSVPGRE